jgi:antitoxin component YwqK of YwqJK toxin-antitoxin module
MNDLVKREGLYYKKFTEVPFTGKITGNTQGSFKNGKEEGAWVTYYDNGQLDYKGNRKNGKLDGAWVGYNEDGTVDKEYTGTFKYGKKISD